MTNAANVAIPLRDASTRRGLVAAVAVDRLARTLLVPMENPSAIKFARPSTRITVGDIAAPATLEITTRVVTIPSFAPYTTSGK